MWVQTPGQRLELVSNAQVKLARWSSRPRAYSTPKKLEITGAPPRAPRLAYAGGILDVRLRSNDARVCFPRWRCSATASTQIPDRFRDGSQLSGREFPRTALLDCQLGTGGQHRAKRPDWTASVGCRGQALPDLPHRSRASSNCSNGSRNLRTPACYNSCVTSSKSMPKESAHPAGCGPLADRPGCAPQGGPAPGRTRASAAAWC